MLVVKRCRWHLSIRFDASSERKKTSINLRTRSPFPCEWLPRRTNQEKADGHDAIGKGNRKSTSAAQHSNISSLDPPGAVFEPPANQRGAAPYRRIVNRQVGVEDQGHAHVSKTHKSSKHIKYPLLWVAPRNIVLTTSYGDEGRDCRAWDCWTRPGEQDAGRRDNSFISAPRGRFHDR